jgi:hypothetical protein
MRQQFPARLQLQWGREQIHLVRLLLPRVAVMVVMAHNPALTVQEVQVVPGQLQHQHQMDQLLLQGYQDYRVLGKYVVWAAHRNYFMGKH